MHLMIINESTLNKSSPWISIFISYRIWYFQYFADLLHFMSKYYLLKYLAISPENWTDLKCVSSDKVQPALFYLGYNENLYN